MCLFIKGGDTRFQSIDQAEEQQQQRHQTEIQRKQQFTVRINNITSHTSHSTHYSFQYNTISNERLTT